MKKHVKLLSLLLVVVTLLCLCTACGTRTNDHDIVVLFTNDIHCQIEEGEEKLTLSQVAYLKKATEQITPYVALVDCGDAVQGSSLGAVSQGEVIVDAMNAVGYDFAALGNHEFDYQMPRLRELLAKANAQYLCCNVTYTGEGLSALEDTKPYEIVKYGKYKVAFVGISTPMTCYSTSPMIFEEDGVQVYDFNLGENGTLFYAAVQKTVNDAKKHGADFVIALAHVGTDAADAPYNVPELVANTTGIDAVLDGHSHTDYVETYDNKDGNDVLCAQTGTGLVNVGQLTIKTDGTLTVELLNSIDGDDAEVAAAVGGYVETYSAWLNEVICSINVSLPTVDENGLRAVRNRETAIGDLCADAYRAVSGADVAYINGGGIRAGFAAGQITYQNVIDVNPYGNELCVVELTGQEIMDILEYDVRCVTPQITNEDGSKPMGEDGSFPNVSGMTFTVDTTIPSPVLVNEEDMLVGVDETMTRRVSDLKIWNGSEYVPVDLTKTYTFAGTNYMILKGGSGMKVYLVGKNVVQKSIMSDYQVLITYIRDTLAGDLSQYTAPDTRITFIR